MAVNDERPLDTDPSSRLHADDEHDGAIDRTVSTVLEGVDRVAEKIKGLLGSQR